MVQSALVQRYISKVRLSLLIAVPLLDKPAKAPVDLAVPEHYAVTLLLLRILFPGS